MTVEMQAAQAPDDALIEWTKQMRLKFSPKGMLHEDGTINQSFFKPKSVVVQEDKRWGEKEKDLLYKALEKYGVGKWREVSEELLPAWDETALRVKAGRLMGTQSLARYVGWKGDRDAVDRERAFNREVGEKTGCWKGGVLVEDDYGSVAKYLEQIGKQTAGD